MTHHFVWAGGFLVLSVGGITAGAINGVAASRAAAVAQEQSKPEPGAVQIAVDPDEALRRQLRTAIFLGRQGEYAAAEKALVELTERHPERASLWLNLGVARIGADNLDGAEEAFERVLTLSPNDWDAVAELANLELERGDLDAAIAQARKIPAEGGRMQARLARDPRWLRHARDPRVRGLRERHGLELEPETSDRLGLELQKRREAAASPPARPATAGASGAAADEVTPSPAARPVPAAAPSAPGGGLRARPEVAPQPLGVTPRPR